MNNFSEKWNKFSAWWSNVFWYHYKWRVVTFAFIIIALVTLIYSVVSNVAPDYTISVTSRVMLVSEQFKELETVIGEHAGDKNGDGKKSASVQIMNFTGGENEYASKVKFTVLMNDKDFLMMILDRETLIQYVTTENVLEPLKNLGIEADEPTGYGVRVDLWPIFERASLADYAHFEETEYYMCFKTKNAYAQGEDIEAKYEYVVSLYNHLKEYK